MTRDKTHWILGNKNASPGVKVMRWVARAWSLFALWIALAIVFTPDPYATVPITAGEIAMLSLWGIAILGLLLAWRWERFGALVTLIIMPVREVIYFITQRDWGVYFLLVWALVMPPAILFLLAWYLDRKKQKAQSEEYREDWLESS